VTRAWLIAGSAAASLALGAPAAAQPDASPRPRSLEISASAIALGGVDFGRRTASLTANDPGNPEFALFTTSASIGTGPGIDARATFNVTRTFGVEGVFTWTRQTAEAEITSDVEGIPNTTVSEKLSTYFIEAAAVVHLRRLRFGGGRGIPFVFGGGGYLRQLDGDAFLIDTGTVLHAGAGVKYFFVNRPRGLVRGIGLRADGRLYVRSGGLELDDEKTRRSTWGAAVGTVVRF
jgi:hypothetical protein